MFFHHEFWTSSMMSRTNEVSFWTNIQTQGHKSMSIRKVIHCGESHWLLASVLGEQDCTIPLARRLCSSLENVSENLSLMLSGQQFKFRPDIQWQKLHWLSRSLACSCLPSQSQQLCLVLWFQEGSWLSSHYYSPGGLLEAIGDKSVLSRLYPFREGI